jgi:hypothetical protein
MGEAGEGERWGRRGRARDGEAGEEYSR